METPSILFLCTGNSCRSQMAEGWMRHFWQDEFDVFSAGIEAHGINPRAAKVMDEVGINIADHRSKTIDDLPEREFDYVITVCDHASKTCPNLPGRLARIHVAFDDPPKLARGAQTEEEELQPYRRVRDEIAEFIGGLDNYLNLP
jgi:arsenate reductase (thioredoxin)